LAKAKALTVVKPEESALPAELFDMAAQDAGKGVSTAQEDNMVPLVYVLQALSPQCNKRNGAYIEGAEPGAILLKNAPKPIVNGEEGMTFQPCAFFKRWVEWVPRESGGGIVASHVDMPSDAKKVTDAKNPTKVKFVRPNGNELIETRYHAGFAHTDSGPLPYVIPFTSSGHTVSRNWMFMMGSKQVNGKRMPSWASLYRLTTIERTNAAGTWFQFKISDAGWVKGRVDYDMGKQLHEAFETGAKDVSSDQETAVDEAASDVM
jgi:hypothetical protein